MAIAPRAASIGLETAVATASDPDALHDALPELLQRLVACGPVFVAAIDPTTLHFTRTSRREIPHPVAAEFLAHEIGVPDVVTFASLAAAPDPVDSLFRATGGDPRASARWRDVIEPLGWGDELRVAVRAGRRTWGFLCLHRWASDRAFDEQDLDVARAAAPVLAAALRRLAVSRPAAGATLPPGVVVLDADLAVTSMTGAAEEWVDLLAASAEGLPIALMSVAARALTTDLPQIVRTVSADGQWVSVHASPLHGAGPERVALVLQPAHPAEALPALAAAAQLTPREAEVADAVLHGLSDRLIARSLLLSERTVQDHLKSVFRKTGVSGRAGLIARLLGH